MEALADVQARNLSFQIDTSYFGHVGERSNESDSDAWGYARDYALGFRQECLRSFCHTENQLFLETGNSWETSQKKNEVEKRESQGGKVCSSSWAGFKAA